MFGSKKKLYAEGVQTQGQVYALTAYGSLQGGDQDYGVKVRVALPDGSVQEFKDGPLGWHGIHGLVVGSVVPVRYDRHDPSKVVLDLPALQERAGQAKAAQQAALDAQFAGLSGPPGAPGVSAAGDLRSQLLGMVGQNPGSVIDLRQGRSSGGPEERLAKLADLRDRGVLTEAEFAEQKAKILADG